MMSAPSRASVMAWLRPWPRAAPVMKATLPSTRPVIVLSSLSLCVCCVQHAVLVLAGFRTKACERVGVASAGWRCLRTPPRPCQLRHGPDDPPSIDPHDLRGAARVPPRAAQPRPDRGDRACGEPLNDLAG